MTLGNLTEPCRVLSLAIPVGKIKRRQFELYFARLEAASEVRLLDVSTNNTDENDPLHPQNFPNGKISYKLTKSLPPSSLEAYYDLEPWRQPFLALGVYQYKESEIEAIQQHYNALKESCRPMMLTRLLVFGAPDSFQSPNEREIIPIISSNFTSLESAMADISLHVLGQLNALIIAKELESFQSVHAKSKESQIANTNEAAELSNSSLEKISRTSTTTHVTKETRRLRIHRHHSTNSLGLVSKSGSISIGQTDRAKYTQNGRSLKFKANIMLLAGQLPEAYNLFLEATHLLRIGHDYLWLGSAIDGIVICLVLQAFNEMPLSVPHIINTLLHEHDFSAVKDLVPPILRELIPNMGTIILEIWSKCPATGDEYVPALTYYGFTLRLVQFLTCLRLGGGWSVASLHAVVRGTEIQPTFTDESPSVEFINSWCKHALHLPVDEIPLDITLQLLNSLCQCYARLKLWRKWAFVVRKILDLVEYSDCDVNSISKQTIEQLFSMSKKCYKNHRLSQLCLSKFLAVAEAREDSAMIVDIATELISGYSNTLSATAQEQLYALIQCQDVDAPRFWNDKAFKSLTLVTNFAAQINDNAKITDSDAVSVFNPFKTEKEMPELAVISGIHAHLELTLDNPFSFATYIEYVSLLDSDGNEVGERIVNFSLPAKSTQQFQLAFQPTTPGPFRIEKCQLKARNCPGVLFKISNTGLLSTETSDKPQGLCLKVLPSRPSLTLKKISLQKGWAMLLEGEMRRIEIEISNMSNVVCSVVEFGFTDSTTDPLKEALSKPGNFKADVYELEYFIYKRQAIKLLSTQKHIDSFGSNKFEFELMGKRGVNSVTILVDYGTTDSPLHRLRIPIPLTVFPSIELERIDVLSSGEVKDGNQIHVTLVIDLRNSWKQPLSVDLWTEGSAKVSHQIVGSSTQRFLVPLEFPVLSEGELARPIPSLTNKQFVVDTKTSKEALQSFWIRETLLSRLHGRWTLAENPESIKQGMVDFRGIQITKKLLTALKVSSVTIVLQHSAETDLDQPTEIVAVLTNTSQSARSGILRFYTNQESHVLYQGNTQRPVTLAAESKAEVKLGVIPLTRGEQQWSALFDIIEGGVAYNKTPLTVCVK